jgi:hypothetical protein
MGATPLRRDALFMSDVYFPSDTRTMPSSDPVSVRGAFPRIRRTQDRSSRSPNALVPIGQWRVCRAVSPPWPSRSRRRPGADVRPGRPRVSRGLLVPGGTRTRSLVLPRLPASGFGPGLARPQRSQGIGPLDQLRIHVFCHLAKVFEILCSQRDRRVRPGIEPRCSPPDSLAVVDRERRDRIGTRRTVASLTGMVSVEHAARKAQGQVATAGKAKRRVLAAENATRDGGALEVFEPFLEGNGGVATQSVRPRELRARKQVTAIAPALAVTRCAQAEKVADRRPIVLRYPNGEIGPLRGSTRRI